MDSQQTQQLAQPATIRARILAMCYDGLIIFFITTVLVVIIELALVGGETISPDSFLNKFLKVFWFVPGFFYFGYYWTKSGQTPSMKIWKIRLVNHQGLTINWTQALLRYITAFIGLGLIWAIFNKERFGVQDIISKTSLVKTKS